MYHWHRSSLLDLFNKVQILKNNPIKNRNLCLQIQESLIKKITYVERRIRKTKNYIKSYRQEIKTKHIPPRTKNESVELKNKITHNKNRQLLRKG